MRIGILGGTFNPIHKGHIKLAREARRRLRLDKVIFIPTNIPPHKSAKGLLPAFERYKMVKLAIAGAPWFGISDYEIKAGGASFTARTLGALRQRLGKKVKIFFITGSDSLPQLGIWKDLKKIARLADFVVASRPGYKIKGAPGIKAITVKTPDISSSVVRRRIKSGLSVSRLLPPEVSAYIKKREFYK